MEEIIIDNENMNLRLDKYLSEHMNRTRSNIVHLIETGNIKVNEKEIKKNYVTKIGDSVCCEISEPIELDVLPQNIPLDIVFEDEYLLVVNKPQGMVVHPAPGNYVGTLVNALLYHCKDDLSGINGVARPGIIHRIDKDTSGLLIVAKTNEAHLKLAEQIKIHSFLRVYNALVYGHFKEKSGTINLPIGRDPKNRKKMTVTQKNSKSAITEYSVLEEKSFYSLVEFELKTGRTHQIRVHSTYMGHPLLGDPVYTNKSLKIKTDGQYLHAKKIGFIHPIKNTYMEFDTPLPKIITEFMSKNL